jgi:hypothetical protein
MRCGKVLLFDASPFVDIKAIFLHVADAVAEDERLGDAAFGSIRQRVFVFQLLFFLLFFLLFTKRLQS